MSISELAKKRTAGGGGGSQTENVVVQITEFKLADKAKSSGDKDAIVGILQAPAFGLDAGTQVQLRMRADPKEGQRGEFKRRDIFGLTRKAGSGDPVKVNGIVEFQRTYVEKDGTFNAGWAKALVCDPESGVEHFFPSVVACVEKERAKKGGESSGYQNVIMADVSSTVQVKTIDEFRAAATGALSREIVGSSGFIFRAIDMEDSSRAAARWTRRSVKDAAGNYVLEDVAAAVAAFEASENGKSFLEYLATYPNAVYEVIPTINLGLGQKSVASASEHGRDLAKNYEIKLKDAEGKDRAISGYAVSNIAIRRPATDSEFWFVTHANPAVNGERRIYDFADLPTPGMPANVREIVDAAAKAHEVQIGGADESYGAGHHEESQVAAPGLNA